MVAHMSRNLKSAKNAGTQHETSIVRYLAEHFDDRVERRARNGAKDRGDISGIRHMNVRVVAELKEYGGRFLVGSWLTEVEIERRNDDAAVGIVIAKRRGTTDPGDQVVFLTMRDLVALMTGTRPPEGRAA